MLVFQSSSISLFSEGWRGLLSRICPRTENREPDSRNDLCQVAVQQPDQAKPKPKSFLSKQGQDLGKALKKCKIGKLVKTELDKVGRCEDYAPIHLMVYYRPKHFPNDLEEILKAYAAQDKEFDWNVQDSWKRSLLHHAVEACTPQSIPENKEWAYKNLAKILEKAKECKTKNRGKGIEVNIRNNEDYNGTPLVEGILCGIQEDGTFDKENRVEKRAIRKLLEYGANFNIPVNQYDGDAGSVKSLLLRNLEFKEKDLEEYQPKDPPQPRFAGTGPGGDFLLLQKAVDDCKSKVVEQYLKDKPYPNQLESWAGLPHKAAFIAASHGYHEILKILLDDFVANKPTNEPYPTKEIEKMWLGRDGETLLHQVLLKEICTATTLDEDRKSQKSQDKCVEHLLANLTTLGKVREFINRGDKYGNTILHYAWKDADLVSLLLENGANPGITNNEGKTMLDYMEEEKGEEIMKRYLREKCMVWHEVPQKMPGKSSVGKKTDNVDLLPGREYNLIVDWKFLSGLGESIEEEKIIATRNLSNLVQSCKALLRHPVVMTFILDRINWIAWLMWFPQFLLYILFLVPISSYKKMNEIEEVANNATGSNYDLNFVVNSSSIFNSSLDLIDSQQGLNKTKQMQEQCDWESVSVWLWLSISFICLKTLCQSLLFPIFKFLILKYSSEQPQLPCTENILDRLIQLLCAENILDGLIVFSSFSAVCHTQDNLIFLDYGQLCLFLTFLQLALAIGKWRPFCIQRKIVTMVSKNYIRIMLIYFLPLVLYLHYFSVGINWDVSSHQVYFKYVLTTLEELKGFEKIAPSLILGLLSFLFVTVFSNIMIGTTITDIKEVKQEAKYEALRSYLEFLKTYDLFLNGLFMQKLRKCCCTGFAKGVLPRLRECSGQVEAKEVATAVTKFTKPGKHSFSNPCIKPKEPYEIKLTKGSWAFGKSANLKKLKWCIDCLNKLKWCIDYILNNELTASKVLEMARKDNENLQRKESDSRVVHEVSCQTVT